MFLMEQAAQNALLSASLWTRHEGEEFVLEYRVGQITDAQEMAATGDACVYN